MKRKHWTEGEWKGLVNYECAYCPYAAAGENGLARVKRHIAGHFAEIVAQPAGREPETLNFASTAASDAFNALPGEARKRAAEYLLDREPSGLTGYTVADVEAASTEEE